VVIVADPALALPMYCSEAPTIGDILKRAGLVEPQRRRRRAIAQGEVVAPAHDPNDEWSIDFKGWFRTTDGTRCDPLTITDQASRFLVEVRIVDPTWAGVRGALERVFEDVGLPAAIRSDNGTPFGSTGAGGLSALSVWWLKLGIEPRYIPPSSPQDNGRHERMHRTLKAETSKPPARSAASSSSASTTSASTTTRIGRTRPCSRRRRRGCGGRRCALFRLGAWRIPGTTPTTRSAACDRPGRSSGRVRRLSSARPSQASWSASPSTTVAAISFASRAAIWA
jgi:transposase InsO family protein